MGSLNRIPVVFKLMLIAVVCWAINLPSSLLSSPPSNPPMVVTNQLLSDPFLQAPTANSVQVVWFTEFFGQDHRVYWGDARPAGSSGEDRLNHQAIAHTTQLSHTREDPQSQLSHGDFENLQSTVPRPIWRHQATVTDLKPGQRVPYRVSSTPDHGSAIQSPIFTLAPAPQPGQAFKVLLTSDHQTMPMTAANLQKVEETLGRVDAVLLAGDLVNIPDRASEWFDDRRGNAFFPCLQGRAHYRLEQQGQHTLYRGGAIIQHAPLFTAIGNHEVMGRFSHTASLQDQFNSPRPQSVALQEYKAHAQLFNPKDDDPVRRQWLSDNSFNTHTYDQMFSLPRTPLDPSDPSQVTSHYYAVTLGDMRVISLYVTQIWRPYSRAATVRGRYQEREADLDSPANWGYGQHIFEPIERGSPQYRWLAQELVSPAFQQAKYTVVMLHHPPHTLGDNIVPPFTTPLPLYDRDSRGRLQGVRYTYPRAADQIARDLVPLLEAAGVDLVFYGHSHLWNRFVSANGTHYLESSNVGNSYGAFWGDRDRPVPPEDHGFPSDYIARGDPNGLPPISPSLVSPQVDKQGQPLPYLASNDITAFSVLDIPEGVVTSYYFDTRQPESKVVKFDQFFLGASPQEKLNG